MSEYQIYTYPQNPRAYKAVIAGKYVGVEVSEVPNFVMGETNKTKDFLQNVNPYGKVPALVGPEGSVWESNAIARYVARLGEGNLFGSSNYEGAQVDQWIDWAREFELPGAVWLYPIMGFIPNDKEATNRAKGDIRNLLKFLNSHLELRTFIVGERVTLADIVIACSLVPLYTKVFDDSFRKGFVNVNRWFVNMVNQPNFLKVQQEVTLCSKMEVAGQPIEKIEDKPVENTETISEKEEEKDNEKPDQKIEAVEKSVDNVEEKPVEEKPVEEKSVEEKPVEEKPVEEAN